LYFLIDFLRETTVVLLETAPYLLVGFFLAGLLRVLVPADWLARAFGGRNFRSVLLAALAGIPLPLCSCSVLPTAVTLRRSGASKGATVSFLVATPETGVDSISITYALLDPILTITRPLAAFVTAMTAGLAVNQADRLSERRAARRAGAAGAAGDAPGVEAERAADVLAPGESCQAEEGNRARPQETEGGASCCAPDADRESGERGVQLPTPRRTLRHVLRESSGYGYGVLIGDIGPYLLAGFLLTGLISALVPAGALSNPTLSGLPSMLAMLVIGIPLYVCATGSTPVVAALILKGLSPGAGLVFLLAGPATNAAGLTVLYNVLGRRTLIVYLVAIAVVSLAAGLVVDEIYTASGIDAQAVAGAGGRLIPRWIEIPAALILLALLARSFQRIGLASRVRERLRTLGRPLGWDLGGRAARGIGIACVLLLYLLTGFSVVGPGEAGWVLTFGRITRSIDEPGLVVHAPYPIERVVTEARDAVRAIDRGYRTGERVAITYDRVNVGPAERELTEEGEVATGEETLISVRYGIQYLVADPYTFRFALDDPEALVSAFGEYATRRVLAEMETDSILVNHRRELETRVADHLQRDLRAIDAGIEILRVDMIDVHAPANVHFAFRDVASAMEDYDRFIRQAESYRNRQLASARAASHRRIAEAQGEQQRQVARASGDGQRFVAFADATRETRPITRLRCLLQTAEKVLPAARLILPLADLPLDLWISLADGAATWPPALNAWERGTTDARRAGETTPAGGNETTGSETWREKLNRLQERNR